MKTIRWKTVGWTASAGLLLGGALAAQTHKVAKPENVVRAVGVYEWTGDLTKPNASRLIPVSLFIDGHLEDAAVYLARPVPFALQTGDVYELDHAGVPKGVVDLLYARHMVAMETAATSFDDGWFGYGTFVPPAPPRKEVASAKPARTEGIVSDIDVDGEDSDKPHFSAKSAKPGSGGAAKGVPEVAGGSSGAPANDPDRPTMKRRSGGSDQTASTASNGTGPSPTDTPADDADRPTLRRRSAGDAKKTSGTPKDSVTGGGEVLNEDPNRPSLHRGKPTGVPSEADFPKLAGLPGDAQLQQMVAVSDAANRPVHDFARPWDDEAEHQAILGKLQAAARAALAGYEAANGQSAKPAAPAGTAAPTLHHAATRHGAAAAVPPAPAEALLEERLQGYTLSYGGAATFVYSAHTDGLGPTERFVTLVAQLNAQGEPQVAMKSVTDAAHLDRTPRMRLVDVVDAEASNRASLLFELREQNARQFALYRVIGARAEQTFATGTTQ